jgi:hypothetical protein
MTDARGSPESVAPPAPGASRASGLLPIAKRYPVAAGAICGVGLRLVFSGPAGSSWSAMSGWFIYLAPILVGMTTVYLAERQSRRDWGYYALASFVATMLFVVGTLLILIEGLICAIVIVPMFGALGMLGGLLMGLVCRLTHWPKPTLYGFSALPFLLAAFAAHGPEATAIGSIERSVLIEAPADVVWSTLNDIQNISPTEMDSALARRIGVPMPISGVTRCTTDGCVRESRWGSQVHFDEVMEAWSPDRYMRFRYRFSSDSFPRAALDDHVVIGGHYFDLLDTEYILQPHGNDTRLTTRVRYRISTHFNFYADWVARLLIGNLNEVGLRLFATRSERAWAARPVGHSAHLLPTQPGPESAHAP